MTTLFTETAAALLARARTIADEFLAPRANQTDQQDILPAENLRVLAEAGFMGLTVPVEYGGLGVPRAVQRAYYETMAAACGVTAFVQNQHHSACGFIAGGQNDDLKARLLPAMARGDRLSGVAFSQLRRPGPPQLAVTPDGDGWRLDGSAPWASGFGRFDDVVVAGTLPDGQFLWAVVPFAAVPGITPSAPLHLSAMNASSTVTLTFDGYYVAPEAWIKTIGREQFAAEDLTKTPNNLILSMAIATAAIRLLRDIAATRNNAGAASAADSLAAEQDAVRERIRAWEKRVADPDYYASALAYRAETITLAVRAAMAAAVATGGSANERGNTAQRLYREAMFAALTAQSRDVQASTLARLTA